METEATRKRLFLDFQKLPPEGRRERLPAVRALAKAGDGRFQGALAWHFLNEDPRTTRRLRLCLAWATRAIQNGAADIRYYHAWALWYLDPADRNIRGQLRRVAVSRSSLATAAACDLGFAYVKGAGGPRSLERARHWYFKAAAKGDGRAIESLRSIL